MSENNRIEKVCVEIQNFALLTSEDSSAGVTHISQIFSLCGYEFRLLLKERDTADEIDSTSKSSIQVLVDLVSPGIEAGEEEEELTIFVWENIAGGSGTTSLNPTSPKTAGSSSPVRPHRNQRRLSNKVEQVYEQVFHSTKVDFDKKGFIENAFRPTFSGSVFGSVGFDIEGNYDRLTHSINIQLGSMEDFAVITTARPYSMKHGDFPYSSHPGGSSKKSPRGRENTCKTSPLPRSRGNSYCHSGSNGGNGMILEDDELIADMMTSFSAKFISPIDVEVPESPRRCDAFATESIDMLLDYLNIKKRNSTKTSNSSIHSSRSPSNSQSPTTITTSISSNNTTTLLSSFSSVNLNWVNKVVKNNIAVDSSMIPGSTWQAIRATTYMNADKYAIQQLLFDNLRIGEYDDMFDFCKILCEVDSNTVVKRMCCKGIWPTTPRDFVVSSTWQERSDGSIVIATRSVFNDDNHTTASVAAAGKSNKGSANAIYPEHAGYVRGRVVIAGYLIQPIDGLSLKDSDKSSANSNSVTNNTNNPINNSTGTRNNINNNINNNNNGNISASPSSASLIKIIPQGCKVTLCAHTELGGSLPASIINMLSTSAPLKMFESIKNILAK